MRRFSLVLGGIAFFSGCSAFSDADGDGYSVEAGDCDDADVTRNPGVDEIWYDGIDQNCDDQDDYDQDSDGFPETKDCDDADPTINPDAEEIWYDGVDQNCDEQDDYDQDGDGQLAESAGGEDCDDENAEAFLGNTETYYDGIDGDCLGGNDYDQDGDGFDAEEWGDDCDDLDAEVRPGSQERIGDDVDQDCDGNPNGAPAWSIDFGTSTGLIGPRIGETGEGLIVSMFSKSYEGGDRPGVVETIHSPSRPEEGQIATTGMIFDAFDFVGLDFYDFSAQGDDVFHAVALQDLYEGTLYTTLLTAVRMGATGEPNYGYSELIMEGDVPVEDLHVNNKDGQFAVAFCSLSYATILGWGSPSSIFDDSIEYAWDDTIGGDVCGANGKDKRIHLVDTTEASYEIFKGDNDGELKSHQTRTVAPIDLDLVDGAGDKHVLGAMGDQGLYVRLDNDEAVLESAKSPIKARLDVEADTLYGAYLDEAGSIQVVWGNFSDSFYEAGLDFELPGIIDFDVQISSKGNLVLAVSDGVTVKMMHLGL